MRFRLAVGSVVLGVLFYGTAFAEPIHIVAFGSSQTYGKNLMRANAYPAQLEGMLKSKGYDVVVINEGISGQTTHDELLRVNSAVPEGTQIVIFQPGGNDKKSNAKHGYIADTGENIQKIVQKLLDRKILVIFSGNEKRRSFVEDFDILTIDEINFLAPDDLQADGQHLTANGYHKAAEKIFPLVEELIHKIPPKENQ